MPLAGLGDGTRQVRLSQISLVIMGNKHCEIGERAL